MSEQMSLPLTGPPSSDLAAADDLARERAIDPKRSILLRAPAGRARPRFSRSAAVPARACGQAGGNPRHHVHAQGRCGNARARVQGAARGDRPRTIRRRTKLRSSPRGAARDTKRGWGLPRIRAGCASRRSIRSTTGSQASCRSLPEPAARSSSPRGRKSCIAAPRGECSSRARPTKRSPRISSCCSSASTIDGDNVERLSRRCWRSADTGCRTCWPRRESAQRARGRQPQGRFAASICAGRWSSRCRKLLQKHGGALPGVGTLGAERAHRRLAAARGAHAHEEDTWRVAVTKTLGEAFEQPAMPSNSSSRASSCCATIRRQRGAGDGERPCRTASDGRGCDGDRSALARAARSRAGAADRVRRCAGEVDYTYVAGAAREALTRGAADPPISALRAGLRCAHVLIDEFQDTSIAQFELLEALTAGWETGDGRTLFAVGDPMQSIYRFRDAEVGLFLRARDRGVGDVRARAAAAHAQFPLGASLVDWTNDAVRTAFPLRDDVRASAVASRRASPARDPATGSCVEPEPVPGRRS